MTVDELAAAGGGATVEAGSGTVVTGLTADSRKVKPGDLFAALAGAKDDGARFVADAIARGASAVLLSREADAETSSAAVIRAADPRRFLALAAARLHGAQPATIVAVTGTAGKTSVASFTRQIWTACGEAAAMIGTTGLQSPKRTEYGSLTTPDPVALHTLLAELAADGVSHAAMEASSHGLDQRRLDGVRLAAGAFTNLGRDHMDYHPTVADYLAAKLRLFDTLLPKGAPAVIFADDPYSDAAIDAAGAAGCRVLTVGRAGAFLTLKRVEHRRDSQMAEIHHSGRIFEIDLPLAGDFQLSNALVAAGLALATGSKADPVFKALEHLSGASGRLEKVGATEEGAPAYVDYAHKPDALKNVLESVRPFTTGRIVLVFGCGGDRDRGKRAIMGDIASRLADVVIVTDDNPRSEEPAAIRTEIMAAAPLAREIGSRAEAIHHAVSLLGKGDTLIVAGKGHEEGQTIGDRTLAFSDHAEVRAALAARRGER